MRFQAPQPSVRLWDTYCLNERFRWLKKQEKKESAGVDKGLVAMFLKMSPEERLLANDNMVCTILELRNACEQGKTNRIGSKRYT
jgi:hypothetical protein